MLLKEKSSKTIRAIGTSKEANLKGEKMSAIESNRLQYHHPYSFSECKDILESISALPNFFGKAISELAQKCIENSSKTKLLDDLIKQLKNRIDSFKETSSKRDEICH